MTYRGDPLAEKLDKLAEFTGVPQMQRRHEARGAAEPVRFRVVPIVLMALGTTGMALQIANPWGFGLWLIMLPWFVTTFVYQFGLLGPRRGGKWDEREAAMVKHSHFVGLLWAFAVAVLGSLTFAFGKIGAMLRLWDFWAPQNGLDWAAVSFFLLVIELNVAVLAAGAATPDPLEDDD